LTPGSKTNKQMHKLFWWLYFITSQGFAHLFKRLLQGNVFNHKTCSIPTTRNNE